MNTAIAATDPAIPSTQNLEHPQPTQKAKQIIDGLETGRSHTFDEVIATLLVHHKIPSLDAVQMEDLLQYLFTAAPTPVRFGVAETAYIHDHDHPNAMDIFLCCTLPLAQKYACRRAYRVFVLPSDWQIELMYDGAVEAAIALFQRKPDFQTEDHAFRRYLVRALVRGALRQYFRRSENDAIRAVADLAQVPTRKTSFRNQAEQNIITGELLEQVTTFPHLRPAVCETLQCIRSLGPDWALKEHAVSRTGDVDKWTREMGRRPILNPEAIAQAMGTDRATVHARLREARINLRSAFNTDGKLFLSH